VRRRRHASYTQSHVRRSHVTVSTDQRTHLAKARLAPCPGSRQQTAHHSESVSHHAPPFYCASILPGCLASDAAVDRPNPNDDSFLLCDFSLSMLLQGNQPWRLLSTHVRHSRTNQLTRPMSGCCTNCELVACSSTYRCQTPVAA
jgi:hypothetical protein